MSLAGYWLLGLALWTLGLLGLLRQQSWLRRMISVNLMSHGVFLVMVSMATQASPPDPILHALVLTGIVIAVSATAVALKLGAAIDRDSTP